MAKLNIADIERNGEPFEVEFPDGETFTFKDPKAIPASELLTFDPSKPILAITFALGKDESARFLAREDTDGYVLEAAFKGYMRHYGLQIPGEAAASPL